MLYGNWDAQLGLHNDSWAGKQLRGLSGEELDAEDLNARINDLFKPRPGWHHVRLGFDRTLGTAFIALNENRIEWPFTPPNSNRDIALYLGGFVGYVDEVRIQVER